jgi:hypothetical protein
MKTFSDIGGLAGAENEANWVAYRPAVRGEYPARSWVSDAGVERRHRDTSIGKTMRIVGVLAFGQSLLFLAFWLLICFSAGAAPAKKAEFNTDLSLSTYEPTKQRSPLSSLELKVSQGKVEPGAPIKLQLDGILYEASNPAAIVNGQVLLLNKVVILNSGGGEVPVRAVEITRSRVVVETGGHQIELRLSPPLPLGR